MKNVKLHKTNNIRTFFAVTFAGHFQIDSHSKEKLKISFCAMHSRDTENGK